MKYVIVKARVSKGRLKKGKKYKVMKVLWEHTASNLPYDCEDDDNYCDREDCASCGWGYPSNKVDVLSFKYEDHVGYYYKGLFTKSIDRKLPKWF